MSFKDRYLSLNGETSLVSKIRLSFAHGTQTIAQGGVTDLVASLASTTKNKINSVVSPAAYAQTQVDSYCNDPQILSYGIAADDFCNTFNERTPVNLNLKDTRQKLIDHGDIDLLTGQPTSADFKAYIKQCASGAPSILYRNDVKTDGGDDGKTDLCVTPGVALKGETKTVAEAYGYKDLQTRNIAWWQKLIGSSAFAAPTDPSASQLVGIHDHYLNWLGYLDDMTDVNQTFTNNFDNNVSTVTGGNTTAPSSTVINVIIGKDTSSIPCASGEVGTAADGYLNGVLNKIRICNVNGMNVNSQVSKNVADLLAAAKSQGVALSSGSFRTMQAQIDVYNRWCAADGITPTPPPYPKLKFSDYTLCAGGAPPGYSNHQMGFAIDFNCDGVLISRTYANASTNHCFQWLVANAGTYGFYEFGKGKPSSRSGDAYEGWHWSIDGN